MIDEADRMMDEIKQDWLIQVETAAHRGRSHPGPVTAASCRNMVMPVSGSTTLVIMYTGVFTCVGLLASFRL